jgi:hypothetical protein
MSDLTPLETLFREVMRRSPVRGLLAEAQIFQMMMDAGVQVIRAAEFAICDGMVPLEVIPTDTNEASRYFHAMSSKSCKGVAFEIKSWYARIRTAHEVEAPTSRIRWFWEQSNPQQSELISFILLQLVPGNGWALIPKWYVERIKKSQMFLNFARVTLPGQMWPAYAPFVVRPEDLKEAFRRIQECANDPSKVYINPSTEAPLKHFDMTPREARDALKQRQDLQFLSTNQVKVLHDGFLKRPDCGMTINFSKIAPLLCDFAIILNGKAFLGEAKRNIWEYRQKTREELGSRKIIRHQIRPWNKDVIHQGSRWHYLLTEWEKVDEAYFVPRHVVQAYFKAAEEKNEDDESADEDTEEGQESGEHGGKRKARWVDIPRAEWQQYRVIMDPDDDQCRWVEKIREIIERTGDEVLARSQQEESIDLAAPDLDMDGLGVEEQDILDLSVLTLDKLVVAQKNMKYTGSIVAARLQRACAEM